MIKIEDIVKLITYIIGLTGFLSVFKHISLFYSFLFIVLSLLAIYFDYKKNFHVPRWLLNLTALAVILLSFFRMNLDNLVVPAVEGLLILLSIKFLEEKRFRDYMQIYAISVFLLSGAALLSIDIVFSIYFIVLIFLLTISIVMLTYHSQEPNLEMTKETVFKIVSKSLLIPLVSIPLTLFLFVALPRTSYPFFNFLNKAEKAKTGFSDNVRLGEVSNIQEDVSAIFRAHMERVDERLLYWRGIVLDYFDGTSWTRRQEESESWIQRIFSGVKIRQTIYLEPYENKYLFALDKPEFIILKDMDKHRDLTFSLSKGVDRRIKYEAVSSPSGVIIEDWIDEKRYLQLPEDMSPEIIDLVKKLISGKDKEDGIKSIFTFLKEGKYKYTLENLPLSKTPLEDFLFKYKHGNCEYFASAMAVMLRIANIPSRLVGGYRGGYYNDIGRYYLVPQKNAHVWVEVYIDERWLRLDPTPASIEGFISPHRRDIFFKTRLFLDAINYYWNAFIIGYNFEKQASFFQKIRTAVTKPKIKLNINRERIIKYSIGLAVGVVVVFIIYIHISNKKPIEEKLIALFLKKMEKHGYNKGKSQGLEEFVSTVKEEGIRQSAYSFIKEFERHYYKDEGFTKEEIKRLKDAIKIIQGR